VPLVDGKEPKGKGVGILAMLGEPTSEDAPDEKVAVARDLLSAIKRNDAGAFASAFKEMHDLCASSSASEYPEADDDEEA
jgi:hypothetical protein